MLTPERFEKIKKVFGQVGLLTGSMAVELLAALENAEGDIITLKQKAELYEEALETYKDNRSAMKEQLVEAQQTIARQREALRNVEGLFQAILESGDSNYAVDYAISGLALIEEGKS
ncbi:MAG TPA: hypothetical protein VGN87_00710 [Paenibacillus sp.]|jgi:predicted alpha/beta superfamily hydrolase